MRALLCQKRDTHGSLALKWIQLIDKEVEDIRSEENAMEESEALDAMGENAPEERGVGANETVAPPQVTPSLHAGGTPVPQGRTVGRARRAGAP